MPVPAGWKEFDKSRLVAPDSGAYRQSYKEIKRLLQINPEEISNLEDLSAKASLIGRSLQIIIRSQGSPVPEIIVSSQNATRGYWTYQIDGEDGDLGWWVRWDNGIRLGKTVIKPSGQSIPFDNDFSQVLTVKLPIVGDWIYYQRPEMWYQIYSIQRLENGHLARLPYLPAKEPYNPKTQQNFLKDLQVVVGGLLPFMPAPIQLDPIFNF